MAQVKLDVVYNVKGMQALKQSQAAMNQASKAAGLGANNIKKFDRSMAVAGKTSRKASAGVKAFGAATLGATGSMRAFGAAISSYLGPIAGIAAVVGGLSKSLQIAGDRAADAAALANGLNKIGAEDAALKSLLASADKLGKMTLFNEEDFTKGFKLLTSFKNISLSSYEEVTTAAADMATVIGGDVNSSLLQLSKALENPAVGLTYLSRSGTTFTDSQKEMIKSLQESGDMLGAQAEIMKVVQEQYGGAALAAGKSGLAGAFDGLGEVLSDMGEIIGNALAPLTQGAIGLATVAIEKLSGYWTYLAQTVFPRVQAAVQPVIDTLGRIFSRFDWEGLGKIIKNVIAGAWEVVTRAIEQAAMMLNEFLKWYEQVLDSPLGKVATAAWNALVGAIGGANDEIDIFNANGGDAVKNVEDLKQSAQGVEDPLQAAADAAARLEKNLADAKAEAESFQKQENAALDNWAAVNQARMTAEQQLLGLKKQQAEAELESASTLQQKIGAINEIYKLSVAQAEIEYTQAQLKLKVDLEKLKVQRDYLALKVKEATIAFELAQQAGEEASAAQRAVVAAKEGLALANQQVQAQTQANEELTKGLRAVYDQKVAAAEVVRQQQLQEAQQQQTNNAIGEGVQKMNQLAAAANNAANAAAKVGTAASSAGGGGGGGRLGSSFSVWHGDQIYDKYKLDQNGNIVETTDEERKRQMNAAKIGRANAMANEDQKRAFLDNFNWQKYIEQGGWKMSPVGGGGTSSSKSGIGFQAFAEGGYVTSPTEGLVGEAGDEYVIPSRKMAGAMQRYAAGVRGEGVVNGGVNVNYSGTTLNFNGDEYVKKSDVGGIVKQATAATGNAMKNSSRYRLENGL